MDELRLAELESEAGKLVGTEADLATHRERVASALAAATAAEQELDRRLGTLLDAGRDERVRLATAEAAAATARERLRAARLAAARTRSRRWRRGSTSTRRARACWSSSPGSARTAWPRCATSGQSPSRPAMVRCRRSVEPASAEETRPGARIGPGRLPVHLAGGARAGGAKLGATGVPSPSISRAGCQQPVRRAGIRRDPGPPGNAGRPAERPRVRDPQHARADRQPEHADRRAVPAHVRATGGRVRAPLQPAVRRGRGAAQPDRAGGPLDDRRRDHGAASRQEAPAPGDAVRRRAHADRRRAAAGHAGSPAGAVLRAGRGGCGAGRGQRRPLLRRRCATSRRRSSSWSSRTTAAPSRPRTRSTA